MKRIFSYSKFFESIKVNEEEIKSYFIKNFECYDIEIINGLLNIGDDLKLNGIFNGELIFPLPINNVSGDFLICSNGLKNLIGCPKTISSDDNDVDFRFDCSYNPLESLDGCPIRVDGDVDIIACGLKNLKGISRNIKGDLNVSRNNIEDFSGLEDLICGGDIYANNISNLYSFNGLPEIIKNKIYINNTPLFELWNLLGKSSKALSLSISYNYIRKVDNEWILLVSTFEDVCDECGVTLPENWKESIKNYKLHE